MKRIAVLTLPALLCTNALGFTPFVVSKIQVDGLQRMTVGTVYNYMPIHKGIRLTSEQVQQAIRALYRTRLFSYVAMQRRNNTLIVKVTERPSITTLKIRGNHDIKTSVLKKGLAAIGLVADDTFDPLILDRVQQELVTQYQSRGKYNVSVRLHVTHLTHNRVSIDIDISEGKTARIKSVNIVGNHTFSQRQLLSDFVSGTSNWLSWYTNNDKYSRNKLSADLKRLQSYYTNRGYAGFRLNAVQVTTSPDKRSVYISADVKEGTVYTITSLHLLGTMVVPEKKLRKLLVIKTGQIFDQAKIEASAAAIKNMLANMGYAYADVNIFPKLNANNHTVDVSFYVQPGHRIYVRRIVFLGNYLTKDSVLRREMRQLEGSWYSQKAVDRSRIRLQRLGFFKQVSINKIRVPGSPNQIDIQVQVAEQTSGSFTFGVGYSQYSRVILSGSVAQNNFLGTGNRFAISGQKSHFYKQINASYYNPYFTDNGIGLGYNATFSKTDYSSLGNQYASFSNNTRSLSTNLDIPLTDFQTLSLSLGLNLDKINTYPDATPQILVDYQRAIDHKTIRSWASSLGWSYDTRNSYWAPTRGGLLSASLDGALPGSTVQYLRVSTEANHYWPLSRHFVLYLDGMMGYGSTYGHQTYSRSAGPFKSGQKYAYPFWQNYYAGGVSDVRGFQDNTLGPRVCIGTDASGQPIQPDVHGHCAGSSYYYAQPIGGAFKVRGTAEIYMPLPFMKSMDTARMSLFLDVGNVYKDLRSFKAKQLDASYGLSLHWRSPLGPLIISLAQPFLYQPRDRHYKEHLQFTIGGAF